MANVTLGHVVDVVLRTLQEDTGSAEQWDKQEVVDYCNLAGRETAVFAPDANRVIESIRFAPGVKQSIPSGRIALIDVRRNMGSDGSTPGEAITRTEIALISVVSRGWASETPGATVKNWMPDGLTAFYVYPPADGSGFVEIEASAVPAIIVYDEPGAWQNALIGVAEKYVNAVINHVLHQCYKKDSDFPGNLQRELKYYNLFLHEVGQPPLKGGK